jgi:drug/metabolite transporter (DMT)-like permease
MDTRRPIDVQAFALTTFLCLIWGFQQVAIKVASSDIAPLMQIGVRSGVAALLVVAAMAWQGERVFVRDGTGRAGLLVGLLFGLEFVLIGEGLRHTTASHMVVFLYTSPIFAALGLHATLPGERLALLQWAGIALAFGGIVTAFLLRAAPAPGASVATGAGVAPVAATLLGDAMALAAGAVWGATTVVVRNTSLAKASAKRALVYQLTGACALGLLVAALTGQTGMRATPMSLASMAFQILVVAFFSYLAWFWLLRRYLASRLGVFTFLAPVFGVGFGVALLGEKLEPAFVVGTVLVLAGVVMVSGYDRVRRHPTPPKPAVSRGGPDLDAAQVARPTDKKNRA